jgi:hypothetical protein
MIETSGNVSGLLYTDGNSFSLWQNGELASSVLTLIGMSRARARSWYPLQPPRLPVERRPVMPKAGAISQAPEDMPDPLGYDAAKHQLLIGHGFVDNVTPEMWAYEVSGKQALLH